MHSTNSQETSHVSFFYKHVLQTPLLPYNGFSTPWQELFLKDETRQVTRAFKFRGNLHRLLRLPSTVQAVTTASTGNHGVGLSTAARLCHVQAYIFVPATTAQIKLQAIAQTGATITKVDGDYEHCKQASQSFAEKTGAVYISGFDDQEVIVGNISLFSEIEAQSSAGFDVVFVPIGGGGLLAACLQHYQHRNVKIVGVELENAPAMSLSLAHGRRIFLEQMAGCADGLLIRQVGAVPFQIAQRAQNLEILLVSDAQIRDAVRLLWQHNGIRAEEAGAAAIAAALHYSQANKDQRAIAIVSGGNIDDTSFQEILSSNP